MGDSTPTISEMDFSSAIHWGRVNSELAITAGRKTAARVSRMMSLVRRITGAASCRKRRCRARQLACCSDDPSGGVRCAVLVLSTT
ncbi:hypothetical protein BZL30_8658 [Mycobacterium kansasii]|uniref:Uncharacterized protein n=1 Tax=Mycobacterium kansasii TaxID=1768 RepID=A0A1V3WFU3_MYCKA|nr:hypothetical protein BZL30_8658 [Mycobacterium kansasii]